VHPGAFPASDPQFQPICRELGVNPANLEQHKTDRPGVYNIWDISRKEDAELIVERLLRPVQEDGIDLWWVDGASPTKAVPETAWTNYVYFQAMEKHTAKRPVILSRYGGLGNHRYPLQFTGDTASQWEVLRSQVDMTARGGNVGNAYLSHDIGGFVSEEFWDGKVNPELFVRWVQFGCFSPVMRLHSCFGIREPWAYEKKVSDAIREAFRLRMSLIPYIYHFNHVAHTTGLPLCRPIYLHYPQDDNAYRYASEYLFGDRLLVAPVAASGGELVVYLPEGKWYPWEKNAALVGPLKQYLLINYNEIPVYVKAGSIIARQKPALSTALASKKHLELDLYPGEPGEAAKFSLYEDDGESRDHRSGGFALTSFTFTSRKNGNAELTISKPDGEYEGMPAERTFAINIYTSKRPARLKVNGEIIEPAKQSASKQCWTYAFARI
jgi:alpha-glucosidase (family GH31 glycosyl hydrolase)